jgi:Trypsin
MLKKRRPRQLNRLSVIPITLRPAAFSMVNAGASNNCVPLEISRVRRASWVSLGVLAGSEAVGMATSTSIWGRPSCLGATRVKVDLWRRAHNQNRRRREPLSTRARLALKRAVHLKRCPPAMVVKRCAIALSCFLLLHGRAQGLVGGAPLATGAIARSVIGIVGPSEFFCTATAIANNLVLTAGHCVRPGPRYKVQYKDKNGTRSFVDIAEWQRPPEFDAPAKKRITADLAVLKLANPLPDNVGVAALDLNAPPIWPGDHFTVIGGGVALKGLRETGVNRIADLVATGPFTDLQIRLIDPSGNQNTIGACFGDSGSPVFQSRAGATKVIAVVSWAGSNTKIMGCGGVTGATLLSPYRQWIEQTVNKLGASSRHDAAPKEQP